MEEYLVFSLSPHAYGVPAKSVERVLRMAWVSPVPEAPPDVLGVLDVRGELITVIDLRPRLGHAVRPPTADDFLIVLKVRGASVAVFVERVDDVVDAELLPLPDATEAPAFLVGQIVAGRESVSVVDVTALLRPETLARLEQER